MFFDVFHFAVQRGTDRLGRSGESGAVPISLAARSPRGTALPTGAGGAELRVPDAGHDVLFDAMDLVERDRTYRFHHAQRGVPRLTLTAWFHFHLAGSRSASDDSLKDSCSLNRRSRVTKLSGNDSMRVL